MANKHDEPLDLMIYSAVPTVYIDPMEAIKAVRACNNGYEARYRCAAPTGWTLDQSLVGSQWRNLWIACPVTVKAVFPNRWGEPDTWENPKDTISNLGIWFTDGSGSRKYIIENWTRVDTLPSHVQYAWMLRQIEYLRVKVIESKSDKLDPPRPFYQRDLTAAEAEAKAFAEVNNLAAGQAVNAGRIGQLLLFGA